MADLCLVRFPKRQDHGGGGGARHRRRKKTKGQKRHIVTDVMGHLLAVTVHAANIHDTVVGVDVLKKALGIHSSIKGVCADAGYRKTFELAAVRLGLSVDISERIKPDGWEVLPKRWRIERTFAWMNGSRRLSKDYEIRSASAAAMVMISHISTIIKRF